MPACRALVCDDESPDSPFAVSNQRKRPAMTDIRPQLRLRIRNAGRKAFLVNAPERFKVVRIELTNHEGHGAIVAGLALPVLGGPIFHNRVRLILRKKSG